MNTYKYSQCKLQNPKALPPSYGYAGFKFEEKVLPACEPQMVVLMMYALDSHTNGLTDPKMWLHLGYF